MATHKVPQDVEAEDKLVGFLSLKQFIFVLLGLGFGYLTFFFATRVQLLTGLIWVLPMVVCLVLGLYQRKDQPVEVFLASALRFYLKPRTRKWDQEGYEERVIVTAPPKVEKRYTKDFTSDEAYSRLGNLSRLMDSRGWASKLAGEWQNPQFATAAAGDRLIQVGSTGPPQDDTTLGQPVDVMDEKVSHVAQAFQSKIQQTDSATYRQAVATTQKARDDTTDNQTPTPDPHPTFQKYPDMRQKVISPVDEDSPKRPPATRPVTTKPTPAPVRSERFTELSRADDLNVAAIAAEAKHIAESDDEVEINLH